MTPRDALFDAYASLLCPALLREIRDQFQLDWYGVHGVKHWARVLENGLQLCCMVQEARADVVVLFSLFHDACRQNEYTDPEHGERAAVLAEGYFQQGRLALDTAGLQLLTKACRGHDQGNVSDDPTVGVCWDSDRLDFGRVRIFPAPRFLSTDAAKDRNLIERCVAASRTYGFPRRVNWALSLRGD